MRTQTKRDKIIETVSLMIRMSTTWHHVQDQLCTIAGESKSELESRAIFSPNIQPALVKTLNRFYFQEAAEVFRESKFHDVCNVTIQSKPENGFPRIINGLHSHTISTDMNPPDADVAVYSFTVHNHRNAPSLHIAFPSRLTTFPLGDTNLRILGRPPSALIAPELLPQFLWLAYFTDHFESIDGNESASTPIVNAMEHLHSDLKMRAKYHSLLDTPNPTRLVKHAYELSSTLGRINVQSQKARIYSETRRFTDPESYTRFATYGAKYFENAFREASPEPLSLVFDLAPTTPWRFLLRPGSQQFFRLMNPIVSITEPIESAMREFFRNRASHHKSFFSQPSLANEEDCVEMLDSTILAVRSLMAISSDSDKLDESMRLVQQCASAVDYLYSFFAATTALFATDLLLINA